MYIILFLLWIIFNANITPEIIIFGIVIAAAVYYFMCRFMDFSFEKDMRYCKKVGLFFYFAVVLVWEILKANVATLKLILSNRYEVEPVIVSFQTSLKSKMARVMLANSITLTPGTITVELKDDQYVIHCLDKQFADGIDQGKIVEILERLEAV